VILFVALVLLAAWAALIILGLMVKALFWLTILGLVLFGITAVVVVTHLPPED